MPDFQPMNPPKSNAKPALGIAAAIAAAAILVTPYTTHWEGAKLKPYKDVRGKMTVCLGETRIAMRDYTMAQCRDFLQKALRSDYGPPVVQCVPTLIENIPALAASIDAAYNAGPAAFCRSPMAAHFRARQWRAGCKAFRGWYVTAAKKFYQGLSNRRVDDAVWSETALCLKGVA